MDGQVAPAVSWLQKWKAFFFPMTGWKARFKQFKSGNKGWLVPGKPDKPPVFPFPLEWVPYTTDETQFDEENHTTGFKLVSVVCCDSGKEAPPGVAVNCLRCGVPLHGEAAGQFGPMDPPVCYRCSWILLLHK